MQIVLDGQEVGDCIVQWLVLNGKIKDDNGPVDIELWCKSGKFSAVVTPLPPQAIRKAKEAADAKADA